MDDKKKGCMEDILKKLPPGYTVGGVFLNGMLVEVTNFSNLCGCAAYFVNDGQVCVVDAGKIDGLCFGAAEGAEEPAEEEEE